MSPPTKPGLLCLCFDPWGAGHSPHCDVSKAIESIKRRVGENVDAWAKRLAEDVADATD